MANLKKLGVCSVGVLGLLCAAGSAIGQTCTPTATTGGPDVIVGDLTGPSNYNSVGSIDAFSIGTYSCNIGNVWLNWFANTPQHPAISQAAYKLKTMPDGSTRFEQLGQSWLKHGFFALSDNLCCNNCSPTDGTHLGVHCADPYTSGRNGSQQDLGPKWQVNAHTGVFNYPPAAPPYSGSVARRLQVNTGELETSSATVRYFVTGQYVTQDDAANNQQNNNESYRAASISGSGTAWSMSLTGSTQRAQQGIRAWADTIGAAVSEADLQIPNDGLLIVACEVTSLAGGMYHYEYALQNMNSDRCGQAFSVPMPTGVLVSNIGFHDVDYHSGDGIGSVNFSGANWAASKANNSVSDGTPIVFSTQTFAQNQSANALRWGTVYNFRFDANVAPVAGVITVNLFKAGTPTSISSPLGRMKVPGTPPPPVCACDYNDNGTLNSQDFFDFLADFLNNNIAADYNGDGGVTSQDFFDFLSCFLAPPIGC